jgi:hypothetical protein
MSALVLCASLLASPAVGATPPAGPIPVVGADGRLLSTLRVDSSTLVRRAPARVHPRVSRAAAERAAWRYMSLPGRRIAYFGLFTSTIDYPVLKNTLMWFVEYPSARVPLLGPVGGESPPQPLVIEINATTGHTYGAMSSSSW